MFRRSIVRAVAFALASPLVVFERALSLVGKGQATHELKHFLLIEAAVARDLELLCCFVHYWKVEFLGVEEGLRKKMRTLGAEQVQAHFADCYRQAYPGVEHRFSAWFCKREAHRLALNNIARVGKGRAPLVRGVGRSQKYFRQTGAESQVLPLDGSADIYYSIKTTGC